MRGSALFEFLTTLIKSKNAESKPADGGDRPPGYHEALRRPSPGQRRSQQGHQILHLSTTI